MHLLCIQGKKRGERVNLAHQHIYVLGREPSETDRAKAFPVDDLLVSREHAEIEIHEEFASVRDLGSANGTRINGLSIEEESILRNGDILTIGRSSYVLEDPKQQSSHGGTSGDLKSNKHATSQRIRRQLRQKTVAIETDQSIQAAAQSNFAYFEDFLINLPMAVLIFNNDGHIVVANEQMKTLMQMQPTPGDALGPLLQTLSSQLRYPADLQTLIESPASGRAMLLELPQHRSWFGWCYSVENRRALLLLEDQQLTP